MKIGNQEMKSDGDTLAPAQLQAGGIVTMITAYEVIKTQYGERCKLTLVVGASNNPAIVKDSTITMFLFSGQIEEICAVHGIKPEQFEQIVNNGLMLIEVMPNPKKAEQLIFVFKKFVQATPPAQAPATNTGVQ